MPNIAAKPRRKKPLKEELKPTIVVECPVELGPVARQEWDRIAPILAAAGRLEGEDRALLAAYCNAWANWLVAITTINEFGLMMKSPNNHPIQSPAVSIANQNADLMVKIATQFGFTPASRLRLPDRMKGGGPSWMDEYPTLEELGADLKPLEL